MQGIHLIGDCYDCPSRADVFCRADVLRVLCLRAAVECGLTVLGDCFHQFEPQGVTGVVLLAESHLAVHTWPEHGYATIDVYACNYRSNNAKKTRQLFEAMRAALQPARLVFRDMERGEDERG
jgi:S-adenosylmethionine decarboxylase